MELKKTLWRWKQSGLERARLELSARFGPPARPERWVFIVGCTNSGTTLLHDILARHPATGAMPGDGHFLQTQLPTPWGEGLERVWGTRPDIFRMDESDPGARRALRLKRQWAPQYDDASRPILLEKTPPNALRMRWLQRHFEDAHFVGIVRHPFAVVEGIHRKSGWPIELGARQWRMTNEAMLEDAAHLRHWTLVRYEDLTERTDTVVAEVADFIGLRSDGIETDRTWRTIGGWDTAIRNKNASSFERLGEAEREVIVREAGGLMEEFGYGGREAGGEG